MFSKRCDKKEILDLGQDYYTSFEYRDCLVKLASIGKLLGGDNASLKAFGSLGFQPESVLDVGCGGGAFAGILASKYPEAKIVGIDTSEDAISYAKEKKSSNLFFASRKSERLEEPPASFDVVTATLVCHHMTDRQIIEFLRDALTVARRAVVINDLHRHPLAYCLFALAAPVCFNNRLVRHDGLLSIRRGFSREDWEHFLYSAKIPSSNWKINWAWAFRWIITIKKDTK